MSDALSFCREAFKSVEEIPYCTGTITLDQSNSRLFYMSDENTANFVDFMNPTDASLQDLAAACQAATYGRAQQDVLDESYRKAGKMDIGEFSIPFNIDHTSILKSLRESLLRGTDAKKKVHFELYKLNVYGPSEFFKAHVDTPRDDNMFGSLVIILPTKHEGGSLVFRHREEEWKFDSAAAVSLYKPPSVPTSPVETDSESCSTPDASDNDTEEVGEALPEAAFVAFFSDVEHEVLTVTSGYRVTLTYNLYFGETKAEVVTLNPTIDAVGRMKDALSTLFNDAAFLPNGGLIGFGLIYGYPFNVNRTRLSRLQQHLKGIDSALFQACEALDLSPALKTYYQKTYDYDEDEEACLLDGFASLNYEVEESGFVHYLVNKERGQRVVSVEPDHDSAKTSDGESVIVWIRPLGEMNSFEKSYAAYGNEASQGYAYVVLSHGIKAARVQKTAKMKTRVR